MENDITPQENNAGSLRFLTLREAAALLQISQRTAMRMIASEELPAVKVGGQWRVSEARLAKWLERRDEL